MTDLATIRTDPNFVNANPATQQAIFDKHAPQDPIFANSNLATQQAIAQKFGVNWESTPGGAAVGNPMATRKYANARMSDGTEKLAAIGGAGALGSAAGYFGPQILQGASTLAQSIPALRPISGALNVMGQITKQIGPTARAVAGGFSGLMGETSGQVAEQMGAGPVTAEAARLAGGAITPEFAPLAINAAKLMMSGKVATSGLNFAKDLMANLTNSKGSLSTAEKKYVETLSAKLMGEQDPDKAMSILGYEMEKGAAATRAAAATKSAALHDSANQAMLTAEQAANAELGAVGQRRQPRTDAISYLTNLKTDVLNRAKNTVETVGENKPLNLIGQDLQTAAAKREADLKTAASVQYTKTADDVNKIVSERETKGESVTSLPVYKSLVASLERELKPGVHSKDVAASYQKILEQIKTGAQGEATPNFTFDPATGGMVYSETPGAAGVGPSFQAIDDARRMLGEAFRGQADEGYKAIGQTAQKKYYGLLSQVQKDFAGEPQTKLLTQYADTRPGLEVFGSKAGTKLTGVDKGAMSQFASDPSKLPDYFFSTPKNYNALIEMVGSKEMALKAAQDYAANQLAPKATSKEVGNWMTTNREFLSAVPEVKDAVMKYRTTLENGERTVAKLGYGVKQLSTSNADILKTAQAKASQELKAGNLQATAAKTEATAITREAANAADNIWNSRAGSLKNVRDAIEGGNMEQWASIAPIIERSPDAKKAVFDAVRQVASEMGSSKGVTQKFNETMRPALEKFGMLGADEANSIAQQLAAIEAKQLPNEQKLGLARRLLLQGVVSYSSSLGGRAGAAGFNFASDIPTNQLAPQSKSQNALAP
jgi:hypothetical protein